MGGTEAQMPAGVLHDVEVLELAPVAAVAAHEGPVYAAAEDALYYTTVPRDRADGVRLVAIERLHLPTGEVSVVLPDANAANGMAPDLDGCLVVCEQGGPRRDAAITTVDRRTCSSTVSPGAR
jgi:sugar lactone lactonase YvrE